MNYRIALMLSVSAFLIRAGKTKLTVVPENIAVIEGDVAVMNCTTDTNYKMLWRIMTETHMNGTQRALYTLYTGNKFTNTYLGCCEISNATKGQFTVKVRTRKDIPLHYVCEEPGLEKSGADLVILGSNPRCEVVEDGRDLYVSVKMWCSVKYVGNWTPVMEWEMISTTGNKSTVDIGSINTTCTTNAVNSTITITAHARLDGCKYTCTTSFAKFSRPLKRSVTHITWPVANNVPEYSFTWESNTLNVITVSNVPWIKLSSYVSRSVAGSITPVIAAICFVGGFFLLIRFITRRQKMDLATQPDETLTAEYEELDGAPKRSAEDNSHVLSVYEQIVDINQGTYSTIPCPNESSYFPQEGEYASPAECHSPPKSVYASLLTTPEQV